MTPRMLGLLTWLAMTVAACDASSASVPSGPARSPALSPGTTTAAPLPVTPSPEPSAAPSPTGVPGPDPDGTPSNPGAAARCSGTQAHRDFFAAAAEAVTWDVYCAVLPTGWYLETGSYRLSGGGRVEVSYRGPDGARLELRQGAFCLEDGGCVPDGVDAGPAAFGTRDGTMLVGEDGKLAVVVDGGAALSWLALVAGLDEATGRAIVGALAPVNR